jgi:uncharacterized protein
VETRQLRLIRRSSFTATPWKNGGGITHEAIRVPARGDPFLWRVSVAHIDASGPFSEFAAYDRKMVLLRGAGVDLKFADGSRQALRRVGEMVEFDGAIPAHCELLHGPCVDLNLMVLKQGSAVVRVEHFDTPLELAAAQDETTLVFAIDQSVTLDIVGEQTAMLEPWDLAVFSGCAARLRRQHTADLPGPAAAFVATLKFVSGQ